jgi:hypothetical protein
MTDIIIETTLDKETNTLTIEDLYNKSNASNESNENNAKVISLLTEILSRIEKIEKTYVSLNADLINQNIKMSEIVNGKWKEPDFEMPDLSGTSGTSGTNENQIKQKDLFYYPINNKIVVYGPGTYDARDMIKQYGEWNKFNKCWDLIIEEQKLLEVVPYVVKKVRTA